MFAIGIGVPISPLLATEIGASWVQVGLMGAAWGLAFTFSAFLTGTVSDRIGRKPVLATSSALSALAALLFLRATTVSELIAIRGLEGLAWACFWPPMEALTTETASSERTGRGAGYVTTIYAFGFALGSFTGGSVTSLFGFPTAFETYFVAASLSTMTIWFIQAPRPAQHPKSTASMSQLSTLFSRNLMIGNYLGASYTFGLATVMALLSVYAAGFGIPVLWIGVVLSIFWIGRIVGAAVAGSASDRLGRRNVAVLALIVGCVAFIMIGFASGSMFVAAGALLAGLSVGGIFPVNVAIIADHVESQYRGSAMGFYEMTCAIAFMIASAFGGVTAQVVDPKAPYLASAVVFACCGLALVLLLPNRQTSSDTRPPSTRC
jgi:DHA1 family multidrug resistance protein-like MFS transporter/DHA1 family quinolone resistance protein-like MFS transporter